MLLSTSVDSLCSIIIVLYLIVQAFKPIPSRCKTSNHETGVNHTINLILLNVATRKHKTNAFLISIHPQHYTFELFPHADMQLAVCVYYMTHPILRASPVNCRRRYSIVWIIKVQCSWQTALLTKLKWSWWGNQSCDFYQLHRQLKKQLAALVYQ